jgi:hypothetical protein
VTDFPEIIREFLADLTIARRTPAYFALDERGFVQESGGDFAGYGLPRPAADRAAEDQFPFLAGALPVEADAPLSFPRLETAPGVYADIHIFRTEGRNWTLLLDVTEDVSQLNAIQQKWNELRLFGTPAPRRTKPEPPPSPALSALAETLSALDITLLERLAPDAFRFLTPPPEWLPDALTPAAADVIHPAAASPFLAHFLLDAEEFWAGADAGRLPSGLWREDDGDGGECALEAFALRVGDRNLLAIELPRFAYAEKQRIIQVGREAALRFDQSRKNRSPE